MGYNFMEQPATRTRTVLVVDDEAILRMLACEFIDDAGLASVEARNADEALKILGLRDDICLVFTDVQMPGSVNGLELASRVRSVWPQIAVIVTSGRARPSAQELPPEALFVAKPYSYGALMPALKRMATAS